jgi:acetolactate synthase-1/2/3 large subunit
MGLGAFPADHADWLGMLGMHGTYEANLAMNECDVMVCIGARFDDRVTGRLDAFSPDSTKIHIDIDRASINKVVPVDLGIVGDCATVLEQLIAAWGTRKGPTSAEPQIAGWRADSSPIRPRTGSCRSSVRRLFALTRDHDPIITTEVGQQMWYAYFGFGSQQVAHQRRARRWVQHARGDRRAGQSRYAGDRHRRGLDPDERSEMGTASSSACRWVNILNNDIGMVRQWQERPISGC